MGKDEPSALLRVLVDEYLFAAKGDEKALFLAELLSDLHTKIVAEMCAVRTAQELKDETLDMCHKPFLAKKAEVDAKIASLRAQKKEKEGLIAAALEKSKEPLETNTQMREALEEAQKKLLEDEEILFKQKAELEKQKEILNKPTKKRKGLCG